MMRRFISPLVFVGAVVFALIMLASTLALLWFTRPGPAISAPATAVLNVIPIPTFTPAPDTPTPPPVPTPTAPLPAGPSDGAIAVGSFVQITGTGGEGLRLRAQPGLQGEVRFLALESEILQVQDGPVDLDGYTWWHLVAPYDEKVRGWAVSNYLLVVENP